MSTQLAAITNTTATAATPIVLGRRGRDDDRLAAAAAAVAFTAAVAAFVVLLLLLLLLLHVEVSGEVDHDPETARQRASRAPMTRADGCALVAASMKMWHLV